MLGHHDVAKIAENDKHFSHVDRLTNQIRNACKPQGLLLDTKTEAYFVYSQTLSIRSLFKIANYLRDTPNWKSLRVQLYTQWPNQFRFKFSFKEPFKFNLILTFHTQQVSKVFNIKDKIKVTSVFL